MNEKEQASHDMLVGALWCIGGLIVTALTYSVAQDGGTFLVCWGAVIYGGLQFVKGLFNYLIS